MIRIYNSNQNHITNADIVFFDLTKQGCILTSFTNEIKKLTSVFDPRERISNFMSMSSSPSADDYKEVASFFESRADYELAFHFMSKARDIRKNGVIINKKIDFYKIKIAHNSAEGDRIYLKIKGENEKKIINEFFDAKTEILPGGYVDSYALLRQCRSIGDVILIYKIFFIQEKNRMGSFYNCLIRFFVGIPLKENIRIKKPNFNSGTYSVILTRGLKEDTHSRWIISHILALAFSANTKKIYVLVSGEKMGVDSIKNDLLEAEDVINKFAKSQAGYFDGYKKKLEYRVLNDKVKEEELGDVVFRFEGTPSFTHFLYLESIFRARHVVTFSFHSRVVPNQFSDLLFSRKCEVFNSKEIAYSSPSLKLKDDIDSSLYEMDDNKNIIVTAYSQKRLLNLWRGFLDKDIEDIVLFLKENTKLKWVFAGAENSEEVNNVIKNKIADKDVLSRIIVEPFIDLEVLFNKTLCFFAFNGVFGGGGGAVLALRRGVPIVSICDNESDISNFISSDLQFKTLERALSFIENGMIYRGEFKKLYKMQAEEMKLKQDLNCRGDEIVFKMAEFLDKNSRF